MGLIILPKLIENARSSGATGVHILRRARLCGIEPNVFRAVSEGEVTPEMLGLSEALCEKKLKKFRLEQTARIAHWQSTAFCVLDAIASDCIVLKGVPLGIRLTGSALWRSTSDIDIWVHPSEREHAVKKLEDTGYRIAVEPRMWSTNQVLLVHDVLAPVEIHWRLAPEPWPAPEFDEAFARRGAATIKGREIPVLCDDDLWIHLLLHAHEHYFALKTFLDLELALSVMTPNEAAVDVCGLSRLSHVLETMVHAYTDPYRVGLWSGDGMIEVAAHRWFDRILASSRRGELVFGEDSSVIGALGVILRAASMALLDGKTRPVKAASQILLCGPHRVGRFVAKHFRNSSQDGI